MGFFRRSTETAVDDEQRTSRLLQGLETAYSRRTGELAGAPLTEFEETVLTAAYAPPGTTYPPPGHSYPSR
ncbi:hypothetical protein ABZV68_13175 [Streptomyces clavifer]|uniref:hypothetical protein n=1 Tax=Streptomyces clavifer TaxID=68188 RepID=UPI0033A991B5